MKATMEPPSNVRSVSNQSTASTAYIQIVHGEHNRRESGSDAAGVFKFATTFRCCSFWVLFCINLLWFVLTVAFAFSGLNPINDDNIGDVGLVIPEDTYQRRANAYEVAKDEADLTLAAAKCAREDASNPIEMIAMKGRFEKEGNGNALTKSSLEELRDHENHIMSEDGWKDRCKLIYTETYPACEVFIGSSDPSPFSPANEFGCQKPFSPVYMFEKYGDPYFDDIPGTLAKIEESTVDWLAFTDMLHKDFNSNNRRSKIMTSTTYVGTPRHEVEFYVKDPERLALIENGNAVRYYDKKHEEREADHIEHWVVENLGDWFQKRFEDTPLRILFAYDGYDPVSDIVIEDLSLLIVALIIVILYMWIYTGSLFITTMGIFQILMSFFGANLLYRYIWPTEQGFGYDYFTLFCALSLFIIVGIGADDIFVYFDTWQGSATHHYKTVAHRMSQVYSHACVAMAVTSATTIFAFLSNLSSPFIGIRTFGVFSALLVTVNYCAVITFFPVVVLVYDNYFRHKKYWWDPCWQRYCKPILSKCLCCCGKAAPDSDDDIKQQDVVDAKEKSDVDDASVALEDEEEEKEKEVVVQEARASDAVSWNDAKPQRTVRKQDYEAAMPLFFREKYAPFLTSKAKIICALLVAVWIVFLAFACLIQVKPFLLYELLPSTHNFHQYTFVTQNWKTKSSAPLFVHVLFGLEHRDPLNTHGIPAQRFEISTSGEANFDSAFELDSIGAQNQLYEVAEEFIKNPRKGLKIDVRNGINTQLTGSKTGSLEFTPDNGESSSLQNPYGVQSFMHAMASWQNVSRVVDESTGSYVLRDGLNTSCLPCFESFNLDPPPSTLNPNFIDPDTGARIETLQMDATSNLVDDCQCYGFFPVPTDVCLFETRESSPDTYFKCSRDSDAVPGQVSAFLSSGLTNSDTDWWSSYLFALGDKFGRFDRMALYDIQVQTTLSAYENDFELGLRMAKKWDDWMDDHNRNPNVNPLRVMVYVENSPDWIVSSMLVPTGISNMMLSLFLAWVVLLIATGNFITATLAIVTIGMICTIVLGFIHILGWGLGPLESILIVIVVGFSVDYTVHLADSFVGSKSHTRVEKVTDALVHTGSSVLSGAISTLGASIPMFGAQIIFFVKFGAFVFLTIFLSLIYSLGFFCALLTLVGPLGKDGMISNYYSGIIESMHKNIMELEEEQALIQSSRRAAKASTSHASETEDAGGFEAKDEDAGGPVDSPGDVDKIQEND